MTVKQKITFYSIGVAMIAGLAGFNTSPARAAECGGVPTSVITCDQTGGKKGLCPDGKKIDSDKRCADGSKPDVVANSGAWGILLLALNILTAGVGIAAVGGIVYASILYASAADSSEQIKKAKEIIKNVLIGLIAYGLMYTFLNFLIPGGIFT